jgi:hypothetical protein
MNVEIGAEAALFPEKEYINAVAVQTKPCFCLLFAWSQACTFLLFLFNLCSVFTKLSTRIRYFLDFKDTQWAGFLTDTFFKTFSSTVNMFISIFMIQIFQQLNF